MSIPLSAPPLSLMLDSLLLFQFAVFALLILLSGFFSSAEVALFSLDPHQIRRIGERAPIAAGRIHAILKSPTQLLSTILIGNTIINVGISMLGYRLLQRLYPNAGEGLSIAVLTLLLLVLGEFAPKRVALGWTERLAPLYLRPLAGCTFILAPFRRILEQTTGCFQEAFKPRGHILSADEYRGLVQWSAEDGALDADEHGLVHAIVHLERLYPPDVMTPRVDMQGLDLNDTEVSIYEGVKQSLVNDLVLYRDHLDNIVGLLDVRAYLVDPEHNLERATRDAFFIPEQCSLDRLLSQMVATHQRTAIVVDEYGGTAGLVTRGDILEELTGDVDDSEPGRMVFEELTPHAWLIDGNMSLEDVQRLTGLSIDSENADRLAGWFAEQAERIPRVGEMVHTDHFHAMVRKMRRQRILLIVIERHLEGDPLPEALA